MKILGFIAEIMLNILCNIWSGIFFKTPKGLPADADFLNPQDVLSRYNHGFSVTGNRAATVETSLMHHLVVAPSGSGKSVCVTIPTCMNLASNGKSCIIHDPTGELLPKLAPIFHHNNFNITVCDMADASGSCGFNMLHGEQTYSELQKLSGLLNYSSLQGGGSDKFWYHAAVSCTACFMGLTKSLAPEYHHMTTCKYLLEQFLINPEAIDLIAARSNNKQLIQEYKMLLNIEPRVLSSVIQTCRASLNLWADPEVQKMTSFNSLDFEKFRKGKEVLFIQNKISDISYYAPLVNCLFEKCFTSLMTKLPKKTDNQVFLIIDEFSSLYLPSIMIALSNLRKFGGAIQLNIQSYSQLKHIYGPHMADAIITNTYTRTHFSNLPLEVCKELEQMAGKYEETDEHGKTHTKPLISAQHIQKMPKFHSLSFIGGQPLYAKMTPYFKHWKYSYYAKLPMPELSASCPFDIVPLPNIAPFTKSKTA